MMKFVPKPKIKLARWIETIIQCNLFLLTIAIVHFLGLDMATRHTDCFNITDSRLLSILIILLLYYLFKVLGTHTAVDLIEINYDSLEITFVYWLFYFYKQTLIIQFEELSFKNRNSIFMHGAGLSLLVYRNKKLKIKLNNRNGWTSRQVKEITTELNSIKPPIKKLIEQET